MAWRSGEAPHDVGIPVAAIRDVDSHAIPDTHQFVLKVAPHTVQHLKLKLVATDGLLLHEVFGLLDDSFIMIRDAVIEVRGEQPLR